MNNETIVNWGLALMESCWNTYASTAYVLLRLSRTFIPSLTLHYSTGIGPEVFAYFSSDGNYTGSTPSDGDLAFYERHGFVNIQPGEDYRMLLYLRELDADAP